MLSHPLNKTNHKAFAQETGNAISWNKGSHGFKTAKKLLSGVQVYMIYLVPDFWERWRWYWGKDQFICDAGSRNHEIAKQAKSSC